MSFSVEVVFCCGGLKGTVLRVIGVFGKIGVQRDLCGVRMVPLGIPGAGVVVGAAGAGAAVGAAGAAGAGEEGVACTCCRIARTSRSRSD